MTPRSTRSIPTSVLFASLTLFSAPIAASSDSGGFPLKAVDDHLLVVIGETLELTDSLLLANDSAAGATLTIVSPPSTGTWTDPPGGSIWTFKPSPGTHGRETLTYALDNGLATDQAQVTIHIAPSFVPIAGRWATADCQPGACTPTAAFGHGAEIGWFDSRAAVFGLCDWRGGSSLFDCVELPVPDGDQVVGWTPLVIDRGGDGFSELALRDPRTGETRIFTLASTDAGAPTVMGLAETLLFGLPMTLPLIGSWDGPSDAFGVFVEFNSESKFVLDTVSGSLDFLFEPTGRPWPLAGDWLATGSDHVGLVDLDGSGLRFVDPQNLAAVGGFQPEAPASRGVPFSGRVWSADGRSFFGTMDPGTGAYRLLGFWTEPAPLGGEEGAPGDETGDAVDRGPLPLDVLVDPPTLIQIPPDA